MANKNSNELEKGLASLSQRSICCVPSVRRQIHIKLEKSQVEEKSHKSFHWKWNATARVRRENVINSRIRFLIFLWSVSNFPWNLCDFSPRTPSQKRINHSSSSARFIYVCCCCPNSIPITFSHLNSAPNRLMLVTANRSFDQHHQQQWTDHQRASARKNREKNSLRTLAKHIFFVLRNFPLSMSIKKACSNQHHETLVQFQLFISLVELKKRRRNFCCFSGSLVRISATLESSRSCWVSCSMTTGYAHTAEQHMNEIRRKKIELAKSQECLVLNENIRMKKLFV